MGLFCLEAVSNFPEIARICFIIQLANRFPPLGLRFFPLAVLVTLYSNTNRAGPGVIFQGIGIEMLYLRDPRSIPAAEGALGSSAAGTREEGRRQAKNLGFLAALYT